tara:strand:+ start:1114 stop:1554 length:441 start_codon:yes stop_codon:yes gene_type:complete
MADIAIPIRSYLTDLETNINPNNIGSNMPVFKEATEDNTTMYFNLTNGDHIIGKAARPSFEETPLGNWKFVNRVFNIELEVYTNKSRQQLYNLIQEIRRLAYSKRHSSSDYQRVQFQQFNELPEGKTNMWMGTIRLQLTNDAVYVG